MNIEELKALARVLGNKYAGLFEDDMPDSVELVEVGEWVQQHKYQYCTDIYKADNGEYFAVSNARSGRYHTDWYYTTADVYPVKKVVKMVEQVKWEAA